MIKKLLLVVTVLYSTISLAQAPAIEWQKVLGGLYPDYVNSIQQTTDGGYILAGNTTTSLYSNVTENHGLIDILVVKLSASGELEWQKTLGGIDNDYAGNIQQTTDGGYILVGTIVSNNGDVTGNYGGGDGWVVKLSAVGALEWQKNLGGIYDDWGQSIQQTTDGGYILAGATANSIDGDIMVNHGLLDFWVVKLSSSGTIEWQKTLGGTKEDWAFSIRQTIDGGYIVAGRTQSNNGDVTANYGIADIWIVKLSATGTLEWQKTLGGTNFDEAYCIEQTIDGGYILSGDTEPYDGNTNAWIIKLSASGMLEWQKSLGGTYGEVAVSVKQTTDGGYIFAGSTFSNNGDVAANQGYGGMWLVKFSFSGTLEWQKVLERSHTDYAYSIQQTTDGGYIVAGGSLSTDVDLTDNINNDDFWVVKLGPELATENFDKKSCIIYPNPATNTLHIQTNQTIDKITITDVTGKKVIEQNTVSNQIDVQDLQQGMYILQVFSGGKTFEEKFVKE